MADFKSPGESLTSPHEAQYRAGAYALAAEPPQATGGVVAFLSSTERNGAWVLPRHFRALSVLGNVELDLRQADIAVGLSVIEAVAVMGNIEITIPPDVAVEFEGDSLLGSFTVKYDKRISTAALGHKTVRVTGTAYAANVEVHVKGPDEAMLARLGRTLGIGEKRP